MRLALFTKASDPLSMGWRCRAPSREGLRSPGRKVNSESLCAPEDQPEKERERERERRKEWHRETKLRWARPITLFSEGAFIPWVVHWAKWKMQSHAESAQHSFSINFYRYQVSSCIPFHKQGSYFLYIIFWSGGLLTFSDPFLIKVGQLEHLLSLEMFFFFFKFLSLRHP